jgi:4-amino-4-deoxy-L-arabinose transferase-like glycosyltransferase
MLARYVIGGWLKARGYDPVHLPGLSRPYDWSDSLDENRRRGRVPDDALLAEARAPMALFAAGAVALLYLLGRALGGPVAGLTTAALTLGSEPVCRELVGATKEAPFVFFAVLGLLLSVLGARRGSGDLSPGRAAVLGLVLGLALATKLTAGLSLVAVLGWAVLVAVAAARRRGPNLQRPTWSRAWAAGRGWALAVAVSLGVFVLSNPHLYRNPLLHTAHLIRNRVAEMRVQQEVFPEQALHHPLDRASYLLSGSLVQLTLSGSHGLPLETVLAPLGAAALLLGGWRRWRSTGRPPAEGLVLLTVLAYFGGVGADLGLAWDRYLLPTALIGALLSGLGASAIVRRFLILGTRLRGARPLLWTMEPGA